MYFKKEEEKENKSPPLFSLILSPSFQTNLNFQPLIENRRCGIKSQAREISYHPSSG